MLEAAGLEIAVQSPDVDEAEIKMRERLGPRHLAVRLAEAKALALSRELVGGSLVVGADQVLAIGDLILDKPHDSAQAREHLRLLRGRTHILHTAVACARNGKILWVHHDAAAMTMRTFSDSMLDWHIMRAGDDVRSSVGAYKIENEGAQLFERIEGSYFTILGLPLLPLLEFLRKQGELPE